MSREKKDKHFINRPVYAGGPSALKKFISANLNYPESALKSQIEGTVSLRYTIDYKGIVIATKIISGLGFGCDEEAIRLVKLLKFKVKKPKGVKVKFHKTIQIHFRKSRAKIAVPEYTFVPNTTSPEDKTKKDIQNKGYNYTIFINND